MALQVLSNEVGDQLHAERVQKCNRNEAVFGVDIVVDFPAGKL